MKKILYISYDGILEPLGQSQVLAYQEILAKNHQIFLISFEKTSFNKANNFHCETEDRILNSGIRWYRLRYHKAPSGIATFYDLVVGGALSFFLICRFKISVIHARSYVPSVIALTLKNLLNVKFIFDMRGFWADERVDGNIWHPQSKMYRLAKWFEKKFITNADHIVSLTHAALNTINNFPYIKNSLPPSSVISTCANLELFSCQPSPRQSFVLGYVGSIGTWYNFEAVAFAFSELLKIKSNSKLLIINQNDHNEIIDVLSNASIPGDKFSIYQASHSEVPRYINQMDAGIFFIKPLFSKLASAPTKLGEFLGCGIPCLANAGVGDMQAMLEGEGVGVAINGFSDSAISDGIDKLIQLTLDPDMHQKCAMTAQKYFSLEKGVQKYNDIYSAI